jgi:hypothetical protein
MSANSKVSVSKRKLALAIGSIIIICLSIFVPLGYVLAQGGSTPITISSGVYPGAPTYTIYADGSTYYSKSSSGVVSSSVNAATIFNTAISGGGNILVKDGTYYITSAKFLITNSSSGVSKRTWFWFCSHF